MVGRLVVRRAVVVIKGTVWVVHGGVEPCLSIVSGLVNPRARSLAGISGVSQGIVQDALGFVGGLLDTVGDLGEVLFEAIEDGVLGPGCVVNDVSLMAVVLNGELVEDVLARDNEGRGQSRKRQDVGELHLRMGDVSRDGSEEGRCTEMFYRYVGVQLGRRQQSATQQWCEPRGNR